jgi:adenylate cyclase class IV
MARITIEQGDKVTNKLDFKEDKITDDVLNIRRESKSIEFDNVEDCEDILRFLNYHKDNTLVRERYTYQKGKVQFEIDIYTEPEALVVSLEGDKFEVDKVYESLETLNIKYKVKK